MKISRCVSSQSAIFISAVFLHYASPVGWFAAVNGSLSGIVTDQTFSQHQITWDGGDDAGNAVSSGIYVYRLKAGNQTILGKMTMMN